MRTYRVAAAAAGGIVLMGVLAPAASAVQPVEFPFHHEGQTFDPCTGADDYLISDGSVFVRENRDVTVVTYEVESTTASGYVSTNSAGRDLVKADSFSTVIQQIFRNPVSGAMHRAYVRIVFEGENPEPSVFVFDLRCVGGPTIYPPG